MAGFIDTLGKIKYTVLFKAPFVFNKALLRHIFWTSSQCKIIDNGIDLT